MLMDLIKHKIKLFGIVFDLKNKIIIIPNGYKIIFEGNAELTSEKDFNITSGKSDINPLTNKPYSINLNCDKNNDQ